MIVFTFSCIKLDYSLQMVFRCVNEGFRMSLLSSIYVTHTLDNCQTREIKFHISKTASFKYMCWQASSGKIKFYINESRCIFFRSHSESEFFTNDTSKDNHSPGKPSILFESRNIYTHSESLVYTMECHLHRIIKCIPKKVKNLIQYQCCR